MAADQNSIFWWSIVVHVMCLPVHQLPDQLQGVKVPIIDFETCAAYYQESLDYAPVIESQVCAGYEEGKKDACQVRMRLSLSQDRIADYQTLMTNVMVCAVSGGLWWSPRLQ